MEKDGFGLNSDCVGGADPSGPDGDGIWIEGRMALARDCSRDREPFPKPQECGRLDDDAYWDFNPWLAVLFDPSFDSGLCEGLFPSGPSDRDRDPLALEISKGVRQQVKVKAEAEARNGSGTCPTFKDTQLEMGESDGKRATRIG